MFTSVHCPACHRALFQQGAGAYPADSAHGYLQRVRISTTEPAKVVRCENNHQCVLVVYDPGYSLLYQRALQRLATGYLRDAVIDAQTSLEMFLAHVPVWACFDRTGASPSEIRKQLNKAQILDSFERIFGAAVTCASVVSGQAPVLVDFKKTRNVRNDAVHKGVEPTEAKAEELCFEVERVVLELTGQLDLEKVAPKIRYFEVDFSERVAEFRKQHDGASFDGVTHDSLSTVFSFNKTPRSEARRVLDTYRELHAEVGAEGWAVW